MKTERESQLEILAYRIWEEEGRPEGRQEAHWAEAERRLRMNPESVAPPRMTDGYPLDVDDQASLPQSRRVDRKPTASARSRRV